MEDRTRLGISDEATVTAVLDRVEAGELKIAREVAMLAKFDGDPEPGDRPVEVKIIDVTDDSRVLAHWHAADGGEPPRIEDYQ